MINILIVDDHQIMIEGLKALLADEKNLKVVAIAHNGHEALEKLAINKIDVVITDINMPLMDGISLTKNIKKLYPTIKVLALSMYGDITHINEMIDAGISGYILKNTGNEELIAAITRIYEGKNYFDNDVAAEMMKTIQHDNYKKQQIDQVHLTVREIEIIKLIAKEYNNAQIGAMLFISERTVESHRKNIYRKTNTNNVVGLLNYAYANDLLK